MADKSIHVFENGSSLGVFPTERTAKGRGTDHIQLHNSTPFRVVWRVPKGVFDEDEDHEEEIAAGRPSTRQRVITRKAKAVAYQVLVVRRVKKRLVRRRVRVGSDPIIIIDVS